MVEGNDDDGDAEDDEDEHCVQVIRHEKLSEAGTGCQADPKYDILHISTYMIWGVTCWYDLGNAQIWKICYGSPSSPTPFNLQHTIVCIVKL